MMKLFLDYKLNESGKGKMLRRLIPELEKIGVTTHYKKKGCDVALGISKWQNKPNMPRVLRVDGVYLRGGKKERWRNKNIRKSIKQSHAVIFQSKFAQRTVKKRLKIQPLKECVIYNGANPAEYHRNVMGFDLFGVIMFANWRDRKHKRLSRHVKWAKDHPDKKCYLIGECDVKSTDNLEVVGQLPEKDLKEYLASVGSMVYLADLDWCPNSVVEARVAGLNVIYDPKCKAVKELCGLDIKELHIDNVALKYKKVFEEIQTCL